MQLLVRGSRAWLQLRVINYSYFTTDSTVNNIRAVGQEPWSSGYGRRLTVLKVMGLNSSAVYCMDIFSHLFVVKLYWSLFEKTENKRKRGRGWPINKKTIRAVIVAQWAESVLPTPEDQGLNPAISTFIKNIYLLWTV